MGAGSTMQSKQESKNWYEVTHPQKHKHVRCEYHSPYIRHDIGVRHFINTGKPYIIEQCAECKREYVKEL